MKLEQINCADCIKRFTHPRAEGQRGRPPKYCKRCKVLRVLAPKRCDKCRRRQTFVCKHKKEMAA